MSKNNFLISSAVLCIFLLLGGSSLYFFVSGNIHHVVLTNEGFIPAMLSIEQGDTVLFSTENNEAFWPASNIHPEHTLYPTFDPKKPVSPDETWSFTFNDAGRYSFHDHLFANYTGLIVVLKKGEVSTAVTSLDINACAQFSEFYKKRQCWDEQLEQAMKEGGVEGAFAYFNALYKTEPDVPKECHGWSHTLGKAGYAYYKEHGDIQLDSSASACGFGFYHAFLGELMKDTGDLTQAREFCEKATATVPGIETSCKHGIGHGASSMLSENPDYFGNFQATADGAIVICKKIYTQRADLNECYDGIYNEIYQNVLNSRYGYSYEDFLSRNDPFWQCQTQDDEYKESCYVNVVGLFADIFDSNLLNSIQYILDNTYQLETRGPKLIAKVAADRIQESIVNTNHQDSIDGCKKVPNFLFETCFQGILNGFIQHGDPNNLHEKGYSFCSENGLTPDEQNSCREQYTSHLESKYTQEQMRTACTFVAQTAGKVEACAKYISTL